MSRYILDVPDMSCMHCVKRIETALKEAGLTGFDVDLDSKTVTLETEDVSRILEILDDTGYPSTVRK